MLTKKTYINLADIIRPYYMGKDSDDSHKLIINLTQDLMKYLSVDNKKFNTTLFVNYLQGLK